ncbi:MAG: thiol:disulfide interchange protein, partial [Calditrichales bacterium]
MFRKILPIVFLATMVFSVFARPGNAFQDDREEILRARTLLPAEALVQEQNAYLLVEITIAENWHVNSNTPLESYLIPTTIQFDPVEGIAFGEIRYLKPELKKFTFSDTRLSVYEGKIYVLTTVKVSPGFSGTEVKISGSVSYQACNDESCLAPTEYRFAALKPVLARGAVAAPDNEEIFAAALPYFELETDKADSGSEFSQIMKESGLFYMFLFIFLGGLALNLTPCVYPLIPITISYFGGQSDGNKKAIILRAVTYVIGMAITYSILGVVASLTGSLLGSALQNPLVLIFIALVLVGLALSMFGLYEIRIPQSLAMIGGKNRSGYLGTLFMGLTVGLIAAPCIGPFVLGLLTYVSELGDPVMGFWMFFVLAMGLGLPFLVLGIFSGAASRLPRSGAWMIWVRGIFGFVLLGMAIYFLEPLFPSNTTYYYTLGILAIVAGIFLGWLDKTTGTKGFKITRNLIGVLFILLGIFFMLPPGSESGPEIAWNPYTPELLAGAQSGAQPVIIDFYADWCIPCKELDKFTFSDERVIAESKKFVTLKADLTKFQSEETNA